MFKEVGGKSRMLEKKVEHIDKKIEKMIEEIKSNNKQNEFNLQTLIFEVDTWATHLIHY